MATPFAFQCTVQGLDFGAKDSSGVQMVVVNFVPQAGAFFGADAPVGIYQIRIPLATAQLLQIGQTVTFTLS